MEKPEKYAYFYDKEDKTEFFGILWPEHNEGEPKNEAERIARNYIPKEVREFCILKVMGKEPFSYFLSNILSIDFSEAMDYLIERFSSSFETELPRERLALLPRNIQILAPWNGPLIAKDIYRDAIKLFIVRKYVEMCIKRPRLFTFGQFHLLMNIVYEHGWHPKTLGFFTSIYSHKSEQYLFNTTASFYKSSSFKRDYFFSGDLPTESDLEKILFDWDESYFSDFPVIEGFEVSNIVDAVSLSLFHLIQERITIKKCANCGKFFVPLARSDAIYCDRLAPQDNTKTCKEYGSKVLWYEHVINDDVAKLARNVYSAKQMLAKRNSDKPEYMEMFEYFKQERKKWEKQVKAGTKTREEYADWLKKMKLCKTKAELEET